MTEPKYAVGVDIGPDSATAVLAESIDRQVRIISAQTGIDPELMREALRRSQEAFAEHDARQRRIMQAAADMVRSVRETAIGLVDVAKAARGAARATDELGRAVRPKRTGLAAQRSPYGPQR